ncbi:MAG: alpha/beta hydrolase [Acidimicrobiales bacterium]|nr:alpha/beta hydrolase [Acidimicrobiales bacterium]MCB9393930.1 alpha/beta hydrolase [Acidimicrobiaceae bacterium]
MSETTAAHDRTVEVPGATIAYTVIGDPADTTPECPPLMLFGSPMDSTGFASLAARLPGRVLVLVDPRNTGRSVRDDRTAAVTVDEHAADLHAVIADLGLAPVDAFASSGGALNALALVAAHPTDVRVLVAHEPPLAALLPDAAAIGAACDAMVAAYDAEGFGPAMARFLGLVMHLGEVTGDEPTVDPTMFGFPTDDDGSRDDPLMANMRGGGVTQSPDLDALRAAPTRIVAAVGEESGGATDGSIAARGTHALAAALGGEATVFPGGHDGFLGGEFGQTGKPDEFAVRLVEVLSAG